MRKRRENAPGWLFLGVITLYAVTSLFLTNLSKNGQLHISYASLLIISELIILVPTIIYLILRRENPLKGMNFKKMHISTAFMTIVFAFLMMPLATLLNIISMFFTENIVAGVSSELLAFPFLIMFLIMAVYGPFCEEFTFRGAIFIDLRKNGSPRSAILMSALVFGLMHCNLNQAGYAFALGICMALLMEVTGSFWAPFLFHMTVNARSVVTLFATNRLLPDTLKQMGYSEQIYTTTQLLQLMCMEIAIAVVLVPIGCCVLVWIARKEGRKEQLKALFAHKGTLGQLSKSKQPNESAQSNDLTQKSVWSVPMILGIIISIGMIVLDLVM